MKCEAQLGDLETQFDYNNCPLAQDQDKLQKDCDLSIENPVGSDDMTCELSPT